MNIRTIVSMLLFSTLSCNVVSAEQDLQAQIDEIKTQIKLEESKKEQLSSELSSSENEVAELRKKLEKLEKKTVNSN